MTLSRFRRLFRRLRRGAYQRIFDRRVHNPESKAAIVDSFHDLYYGTGVASEGTWRDTYWLGTAIRKCPLDLWVYQEILTAVRPDLIIETGTGRGGSAHFLACICDVLQNGQVTTIDVTERDRPAHDRVTYLNGSSTAPEIRAKVQSLVDQYPGTPTVMVILDSGHSKNHVLEELRSYHTLVTPGSYLVVEDTNVNGHPVERGYGPGPMEATEEFLSENREFSVDTDMEKFLLTFNPGGFLKRRAEQHETPEAGSGTRS